MSAGKSDIEERISMNMTEYSFYRMNIEDEECGYSEQPFFWPLDSTGVVCWTVRSGSLSRAPSHISSELR
jgi:hypothetical protein